METFGHPTWVVLLRFKNIAAFALHKRAAWGLDTFAMFQDSWDAAHITTWNFLPSLLRHIGQAPLWAVHVLYGVWAAVGVGACSSPRQDLIRVLNASGARRPRC